MVSTDAQLVDMLKEVKSKSTIILERCLFALNVSALLFGNFMTLLVLVLNRQMRTVPNMFVASPVVSDFSTGIFSNILSFYSGIVSKWPFGDATCRFQSFLSSTLALTSVHTMASMAVNRHFRIVKPGKYRQLFTKTKTKTMIVAHGFTQRSLLCLSCSGVGKKWCTIPSRISATFTSSEAAVHFQPLDWYFT